MVEATDAFLHDWSTILGYANPVMTKENHHAEGYTSDGNPVMDNSELFPNDFVPMPLAIASVTRSYASHSPHRSPLPQSTTAVGRLAYFRQSLKHQNISTEAEVLIIAAWRESTNENYASA